jgi:hypothetical protein
VSKVLHYPKNRVKEKRRKTFEISKGGGIRDLFLTLRENQRPSLGISSRGKSVFF